MSISLHINNLSSFSFFFTHFCYLGEEQVQLKSLCVRTCLFKIYLELIIRIFTKLSETTQYNSTNI